MPNLGPTELIIVLVIILAIFGAGKLAGLGGALGKGIREFRKGKAGAIDTIIRLEEEAPAKHEAQE